METLLLFNLTAGWLQEVCYNVAVEPPLLPLNGETTALVSAIHNDEARADVHATGFWGRCQGAFFDIRVFHTNTPSYLKTQPASLFRRHGLEKKRENGDRVCSMECGSFIPLVFSTFGGLGREATIFYSRLADLLSKKHGTPYTSLMRCSISFSLLRSAILAIRGSRTMIPVHVERPTTSAELRLAAVQLDSSV